VKIDMYLKQIARSTEITIVLKGDIVMINLDIPELLFASRWI